MDICIFVALLIYKLRMLLYTSFIEFVYCHKILPLKVCNSVDLVYSQSCPAIAIYTSRAFSSLQKETPYQSVPTQPPRSLSNHGSTFCLYGFADCEFFIQVDQSFTHHDVCKVHSCDSVNQHFTPFRCQIVSHCIRNHILLINH